MPRIRASGRPAHPVGRPRLQGLGQAPNRSAFRCSENPKLGTRNELTEQEFENRLRQAQQAVDDMEAEFDLVTADTSKAGQVARPASPPPHWQERGTPSRQASLIVRPPERRMPALTPQARARYDAIQHAERPRPGGLVHHLQPLRPLHRSRGHRPARPAGDLQQRQRDRASPGYVVIRNEMIHESRIVPLDGRPQNRTANLAICGWAIRADTGRVTRSSVETRNLTDRTGISQGGNNPHSDRVGHHRALPADRCQYAACRRR